MRLRLTFHEGVHSMALAKRFISPILLLTLAVVFASGLAILPFVSGSFSAHASTSSGFNNPGNLLITDQFNNRAIEVDRNTKKIVWSFGSGQSTLCNPGPGTIIGLNDAERLSGGLTLLAGTGIPANTVPG